MKTSPWILLILQILLCCCEEKKETRHLSPIRVKTELTSVSAGNKGITYVGIVEENEGTAVSFTNMGVVKRIYVNEGQPVSRGQLIAEMDDSQARHLLSGAEAQMAQANDALSRYQMLHDNGSLPEIQWVEIQSKVAQARSQLEVARKNLADCRLIAPVSGVIGKRQVSAGETALPSQAVVTIFDISTVKVKVSIPETEMSNINAHTSSYIKVDAINRSYGGGRIEKGIQADALTHTYDVKIHVVNTDRKLLPGMVANVLFHSSSGGSPSQITLPVTAVQKNTDNQYFVWTIANDSTAHRTKVSIGDVTGNRITISGGLTVNQPVVIEGYQKLSEGKKVIY